LGDYTWLTAYDRKVYGTWTEAFPLPRPPQNPVAGLDRKPPCGSVSRTFLTPN